jgi:isochorismate synthase
VVISRAQFFSQKVAPLQLFEKLCAAYPQLTVYLFSHPKVGTWCGATPETLLALEGETLKTMSLAGTMPLGHEADFSSKEYHEQQLVTNFIEDTLKENRSLDKVKVASVSVSKAGQVAHLQSLIEAQVKPNFELSKLLEKLHPTPAVSGLPRQAALNFIAENENYNRSFYSGYFGISQQQQAHYWVNLRCMQIFEEGFALYAGGGITAQSAAQSEWEETQAKMDTLLRVVNP